MRKLFSLFAALTLSVGLWAANSVITFTSTGKLYPVNIMELMMDNDKWAAFKVQYPEFANLQDPFELDMMGISSFNPNAFLDANDQVLNCTIDYDESTHAGTITVNGKLVKIASYAFGYCGGLTSITLPEGVTSIGGSAFYGCAALTSITIPEGVTSIESLTFYECTALTSVILPESLSSIGEFGFVRCHLSSVTIPANVTFLGNAALGSISSLTDVYVAWTTTLPTLVATFRDSPISTATLHVPVGSKELYQDADVWKDFGSIVEYVPLPDIKTAAIAAVNAEIAESDNDNVKAIATSAATAINAATTEAEVNALKSLAIANIASAKAAYTAGDAAGYARAKAELPTEGTSGPAVTITKGDKTVTFYNTDKVEYSIVDAD